VIALGLSSGNGLAEEMTVVSEAETKKADPRMACQTDQHRGFDFWLGKWKVTTPSRPNWHASSQITVGNNGCSIHEAYKTPDGYGGSSVNFFDKTSQQWHQTWIDNQGNPLYLNGKLEAGSMVLSDGQNEITWTALEDGRVRQHWQVFEGDGKTKKTAFDGYYQREIETP
jgi:hypothetical protein